MAVPMAVIWLAALILFCALEAVTATALISIWFAVGALAALVVSLFVPEGPVSAIVFLGVSVLALALVRPLAKKFFNPKVQRTNADRLVGEEAVVTEAVDNLAGTGQVRIRGSIWTARSEEDAPLAVDTHVRVLRIEGVKLIVRADRAE